jgi:predicted MFS family arabinose efflux permease
MGKIIDFLFGHPVEQSFATKSATMATVPVHSPETIERQLRDEQEFGTSAIAISAVFACARVIAEGHVLPPVPSVSTRVCARHATPLSEVFRTLLRTYPQRTIYGLSLMIAQAFFYNAIFFTYALVLTDFYDVPATKVGTYLLPFALGNFLGPLLLGRMFDVVGRRTMIAATYAISGLLLLVSGALFKAGVLDSATQTIAWTVVFFFASAAASSAYLTVSETFPLEVRALAIALFYAVGTGLGGVAGPALFGWLIDTHSRGAVFGGYAFGAVLMLLAAAVQAYWGTAAERKPLEHVAAPLSVDDSPA